MHDNMFNFRPFLRHFQTNIIHYFQCHTIVRFVKQFGNLLKNCLISQVLHFKCDKNTLILFKYVFSFIHLLKISKIKKSNSQQNNKGNVYNKLLQNKGKLRK